jgi:hypothetical protein
MVPPCAHGNVAGIVKTGSSLIFWTSDPGCHIPVGAGTHGIGTPAALAVRKVHVPKGGMLVIGAQSATVATGKLSMVTIGFDVTVNGAGATPPSHIISAV